MRLGQLLYISDAKEAMSSVDLTRLVTKCGRKNSDCNVTGLLLYSAGHFIQLLEGHLPLLENLFAKISRDSRHHNIQLLHFGACTQRLFPTWQMGLLNMDDIDALNRPRLLELANRLNQHPDGKTIASVFGEFRRQLPAWSVETERVA